MKEPSRQGKHSSAAAQFFCVIVPRDRVAKMNNNMFSVTVKVQKIISSGHLT